jgi:hypothetical protein
MRTASSHTISAKLVEVYQPYFNLGLQRGCDVMSRLGESQCKLSAALIEPMDNKRPANVEASLFYRGHYDRLQSEWRDFTSQRENLALVQGEIGAVLANTILPTIFRVDRVFPHEVSIQLCDTLDATDFENGSRRPVKCGIRARKGDFVSPDLSECFDHELFDAFRGALDKLLTKELRDGRENNYFFGGLVLDYDWKFQPDPISLAWLPRTADKDHDWLNGHKLELEAIAQEVGFFDLLPAIEVIAKKLPKQIGFVAKISSLTDPLKNQVKFGYGEVEQDLLCKQDKDRLDVESFCRERLLRLLKEYLEPKVPTASSSDWMVKVPEFSIAFGISDW